MSRGPQVLTVFGRRPQTMKALGFTNTP